MQYNRIILAISVIACYWNALFCGFVFDDASAIRENRDLRPETPWIQLVYNDFWGTPLSKEHSHKSYRPLTVATFRVNYYFGRLDPVGYHFLNICFHLAVVLLFYETLNLVFVEDVSFSAAILFSVHPIHCEAVTGVVGRAECLSGIFFLLTIYFYLREWRNVWMKYFTVFVLSFASTFSKEQGITVFGVLIALEFSRQLNSLNRVDDDSTSSFALLKLTIGRRKFWLKTGALIGMASVTLVIRFLTLKGSLPAFTSFDNPASAAEFPVRQLTYNYLVAFNSWLLLNPNELCADWSMGTINLVSPKDSRILSIFLFYSILALLIIKILTEKLNFGILFALSLLIFPFIPASNLFFPVGFVVAERVLYLPSLGFSLIVSLGLKKFSSFFKFARPFFYIILTLFALKTFLRNFDWRDDFTLFNAGLRITKMNAKIWNNIGHFLERKGEFPTSGIYFDRKREFLVSGTYFFDRKNEFLASCAYFDRKNKFPASGTYFDRIN